MKNSTRLVSFALLSLCSADIFQPAQAMGHYEAGVRTINTEATLEMKDPNDTRTSVSTQSSTANTGNLTATSRATGAYRPGQTTPLEIYGQGDTSMSEIWAWVPDNGDQPVPFFENYTVTLSGHVVANAGIGKTPGSHVLAEAEFDLNVDDGEDATPVVADPEMGEVQHDANNPQPATATISIKPTQAEQDPNFTVAFAPVQTKTLTAHASVKSRVLINSAQIGNYYFSADSGTNTVTLNEFHMPLAVSGPGGTLPGGGVRNPR